MIHLFWPILVSIDARLAVSLFLFLFLFLSLIHFYFLASLHLAEKKSGGRVNETCKSFFSPDAVQCEDVLNVK